MKQDLSTDLTVTNFEKLSHNPQGQAVESDRKISEQPLAKPRFKIEHLPNIN
jgi:hypothetical protein